MDKRSFKYSLVNKLMLVIGSITLILMVIISLSILFQWRKLIIANQEKKASSITEAISTSLIDVFIYGQTEDTQFEDLLERYINNFINSINEIKFIAIYDNSNHLIAHSDYTKYDKNFMLPVNSYFLDNDSLLTAIHKNANYGWIIETIYPLNTANKRWGVLNIGFDAEVLRSEIKKVFFLLLLVTSSVLSATLFVLYKTISQITNSLRILVNVIDKTDIESDTNIVLPQSNDEIGFLNYRFSILLQRLSNSKIQLIEAQRQIHQAEKLASIGRLASGVAHEINNPLNGIKNCLYAIYKEPQNHIQTKEFLKLIEEGINYIETVVQKLLSFARQQPKAITSVNINEIIEKVSRLLDYKIKDKQIRFELNINRNLPVLNADEQLLTEVFMNIILNSIDAVQQRGIIKITTGLLENDEIFISVIDNGVGIKDEDIPKIFDPFYTTKGPSEGTGLGLSVSLGIVEAHGGTIRVKSIPNYETEFRIILPLEVKK